MENRYFNSLHYIDSLVGKLYALLEEKGLLQDTIIMITGDHGECFNEHGDVAHASNLYQETLRVPLIIWNVANSKAQEVPQLANLIDIAPTILALAKLPPHDNFQGRSLIPIIDPPQFTNPVFATLYNIFALDAAIVWPWKYIYNVRTEREMLFNLERDPNEREDVKNREHKVLACMRQTLQEFREKQIEYHKSFELYSKYFPPKHQDLSESCKKALLQAQENLEGSIAYTREEPS